jgi:uncharacterized membrane protein YfcA
MMDLAVLALASLFAGCIDAIVGGGGLILTPALFSVFPNAQPATLFGTNKVASISGTSISAVQFTRRVTVPWKALAPATAAALIGALSGAWVVTVAPADGFRKALPFVMAVVLVYTVFRKDMGRVHAPLQQGRRQALVASAIGLIVGFYDGLFGPGTGSFFIFAFVRLMGFDFLHASASAKLVNVGSNFAALALFTLTGHVWWQTGIAMAVANVVGSLVGTRLALRHGAAFVRIVFIVVVTALILKTGWDAFFKA